MRPSIPTSCSKCGGSNFTNFIHYLSRKISLKEEPRHVKNGVKALDQGSSNRLEELDHQDRW